MSVKTYTRTDKLTDKIPIQHIRVGSGQNAKKVGIVLESTGARDTIPPSESLAEHFKKTPVIDTMISKLERRFSNKNLTYLKVIQACFPKSPHFLNQPMCRHEACHQTGILMLKETDCSDETIYLLETIINISEILYSKDASRSPRKLLQLYNSCWLHMELCAQLSQIQKKLTRTKFFGHYLNALTAHSPELVFQRSINAENQEKFFGQA